MSEGIDPVCASKSEWRDIGHGVSIRELRNKDGILLAIHFKHNVGTCPIGSSDHNFVSTKNYMPDGWDLVSDNPLTLAPSLLCNHCQYHGFIQNGRWVPC